MLPQALKEENFDGLVDPRLPNEYNHNEMLRMINCAACCVKLSAQHRPQMSQVISLDFSLKGYLQWEIKKIQTDRQIAYLKEANDLVFR